MVRVVEDDGTAAQRVDGVWHVVEARTWWVHVEGGPWEASLEGRRLAWDGARSAVALNLPFAVGRVALTMSRPGQQHRLHLEVRPHEAKLGANLWMTLLEDLEHWLTGITAGVEGPRQAGLSLDGLDLPVAVEATLPLLPDFERALREVLRDPRTRASSHLETLPVHMARHADRESIQWLSRHPEAAAWFLPDADPDASGPPPQLPIRTTREVVDHPANRHLVWLVHAVARRLDAAAVALDAALKSELNDTEVWCAARARAMRAAADRLRRLLRTSALADVPTQPASEAALLVILDAPAYARAHRLGRQVLKLGFTAESKSEVATRPSYHLYELWCFMAIQRAVAARVPRDWKSSWRDRQHLMDLASTGSGARWVATSPNEDSAVGVWFNPLFRSRLTFPEEPEPIKRHALTGERRPDVAITIRHNGRVSWLSFDAKYRVGRSSLTDAFTSAHLYRDALRWPEHAGAPAASVLLCPDRTADTDMWYAPWFHARHHLGALVVRPGNPSAAGFAAWLDTYLPNLHESPTT